MKTTLINIALFQTGWFACVLTAASNQPVIGAIIALTIIVLHLLTVNEYKREMRIIAIAMLIGLIWDSILVAAGWINYTSGMISPLMAPYWIVLMWGLFAMTLNYSLSWLKEKLILAAVFGAIAGPLAYYAGFKLGAVELTNESYALIALSIGWGIFTPLLLKITRLNLPGTNYINGETV